MVGILSKISKICNRGDIKYLQSKKASENIYSNMLATLGDNTTVQKWEDELRIVKESLECDPTSGHPAENINYFHQTLMDYG